MLGGAAGDILIFEKPGSDLEPNGGGSLLAGRPTIRGLLSCAAVLDGLGHTDGGVKIGLALGKYPLPHCYFSEKMQCRVAAVCFAVPSAETISGRGCWILYEAGRLRA
ncbi:hypothetical protein IMZ48_41850 [Candidatus Bathyarchaeota archaeon]|nr:hypothetical protein [Candidatus Bathyarchaeota archaeon]